MNQLKSMDGSRARLCGESRVDSINWKSAIIDEDCMRTTSTNLQEPNNNKKPGTLDDDDNDDGLTHTEITMNEWKTRSTVISHIKWKEEGAAHRSTRCKWVLGRT